MLQSLKFDILAKDQTSAAFAAVRRSLGQTERVADQVGVRLSGAGRRIAAGIGGLVTIQAFRAISRASDEATAKLDEIAKTADSIGLTTGALQELRVAAELSGVSTDTHDAALRRFSRTASDAAKGLATAEDAFDALNISVTDGDGQLKGIDRLVSEVADRFAGLENSTRKAALAQELFGRGGVPLVNLLNEGADGIENMRQRARDLGIVIDESLIREAEGANDAMTLLEKTVDAKMTTALVSLQPAILSTMGFLAEMGEAAGDAWRAMARLAGVRFTDAAEVPRLTTALGEAQAAVDALDAEFKALAETGQTSLAESLGFKSTGPLGAEDFNTQLEIFADRRAELVADVEAIQAQLGQALSGLGQDVVRPPAFGGIDEDEAPAGGGGRGRSEADAAADAFARLTDRLREQITAEVELRETIGLSEEAAAGITDQYELQRLELDLLATAQEAKGRIDTDEIGRARLLVAELAAVRAARRADEAAIEAHNEATREAEDAERALTETITGPLREALTSGEANFRTFADALVGIADRMADHIIDGAFAEIERAIDKLGGFGGGGGGGLFGAIGNVIGGLFGGGGGVTTAANNPFSGGLYTASGAVALPGFASGGAFTVGGSPGIDRNVVAFMASRGERVDVSPQGAGGSAPKVEVHIHTPPGSEVTEERQQSGDTERLSFFIDQAVGRSLTTPGRQGNRALQANFGARQQLVRR